MTVLYLIAFTVEWPTRRELLTQLACINFLWRNIGNGLGVSYSVLQGLAESNQSNQAKLDQVIQNWLDMNGQGEGAPVTWSTILDVVNGPLVQNKALAMTIYEYLKLESSVQQITQSKQVIVPSVISFIQIACIIIPWSLKR